MYLMLHYLVTVTVTVSPLDKITAKLSHLLLALRALAATVICDLGSFRR